MVQEEVSGRIQDEEEGGGRGGSRLKEIGLSFEDRSTCGAHSEHTTDPEFWNTIPNEISLSLTSRAEYGFVVGILRVSMPNPVLFGWPVKKPAKRCRGCLGASALVPSLTWRHKGSPTHRRPCARFLSLARALLSLSG
jgi:hypothetical protein